MSSIKDISLYLNLRVNRVYIKSVYRSILLSYRVSPPPLPPHKERE